jgi:hypothetical protein
VKRTYGICVLLIAIFLLTPVISFTTVSPVSALQNPVEVTDVVVPIEVAQAASGQVQATVHNLVNNTLEGWARFSDNLGEIISEDPSDPYDEFLNFTISPYEELPIVLGYSVVENATIGTHIATFEVNVGSFSFLFEQYEISVVSAVRILSIAPGQVSQQNQLGSLVVSLENRVTQTVTVRLDTFGPKFTNSSEEYLLSPGQNDVVLPLMNNMSHIYDFGMFLVNVSLYYLDERVDSQEILVPVDMTFINKLLAVILPVVIFILIVVFYAYRKRRRIRTTASSE